MCNVNLIESYKFFIKKNGFCFVYQKENEKEKKVVALDLTTKIDQRYRYVKLLQLIKSFYSWKETI